MHVLNDVPDLLRDTAFVALLCTYSCAPVGSTWFHGRSSFTFFFAWIDRWITVASCAAVVIEGGPEVMHARGKLWRIVLVRVQVALANDQLDPWIGARIAVYR